MEITAIIQLVVVLIGAAGTAFGAYQKFRSRENLKGWEKSGATLAAVVTAIELMPSTNPIVQQAKVTIRQASEIIGVEKEVLAKVVDQIQDQLVEIGFMPAADNTEPEQIVRAAKAIAEYRKLRGGVK